MKNLLTLILCAGPLAGSLFAQRGGEATNSLSRARATFDAADFDKDQKLNLEELQKQRLGIQKADFDAMDADKNGTWSREEFLVFYRRLLLNGSQRPAADLEAEVTRIQAMRKAKAAETAPKRTTPLPKPAETPAVADARMEAAIDDLEKKSAMRQATRVDFDRVREALALRATAGESAAETADLKAKFESALGRLEAQAKQGTYSREEFNALRAALIKRGREAANEAPATNELLPEEDARLQSALDDLARKAEARQATRDDFNRVRDAWVTQSRAASGSDPAVMAQQSALAGRFARAIDELEQQAAAGNWSREKFEAVRAGYIKRGRQAAGGTSQPGAVQPVSDVPADIETQLQLALDELARKAEARGATREDFNRVRDAWTARAKAAGTSADPVAAAEQSALAERFARAMDDLEQQALSGNWSRDQFEAVRASYIKRARASVGAGAPSAESPAATAAPAEVEKRFEEALDTLQKRTGDRTATPEDFQRVNDLATARARVAVKGPDGVSPADPADPRVAALSAQLKEALARLEKAAQSGAISPDDFAALRKMYVTRAREAASGAKDVPGPASARGARTTPEQAPAPKRGEKPVEPPKPVDPPKSDVPPTDAPKTDAPPKSETPPSDTPPKAEENGSRGSGEKPPPAPEPQPVPDPKEEPPKEGRPASKPPHRI